MANQFITNQTPSTYSFCMYNLLNVMYNAGWSIMAWSDGATVHNTGTIPGPYSTGPGSPDPVFPLTGAFPNTGNSGVGGLNTAFAWFVMRQPKGTGSLGNYGGKRMFAFQITNGAGSFNWKIKYSLGGGYQFASAATVMPSLYSNVTQDDTIILGGGTDASPTFGTLFGGVAGNNGLVRFNCMANDGLSGETSPFGIWATAFKTGGGIYPDMAFIFDPLVPGTTGVGDVDPFVFGVDTPAGGTTNGVLALSNGNPPSTYLTFSTNGSGGCYAWFRYGLTNPGPSVQKIAPAWYGVSDSGLGLEVSVPGVTNTGGARYPLGSNPFNANDDLFPMVYIRPPAVGGGTSGYKGVGFLLKWNSTPRSIGDTQAQVTARDRIVMGVCSLPWDGTVPTI